MSELPAQPTGLLSHSQLTVWLPALSGDRDAKALVRELAKLDFAAKDFPVTFPDGRTWHRIRVGGVGKMDDPSHAAKIIQRLEREPGIVAFSRSA